MSARTQERVYEQLHRLPRDGLAAAKQLFWTELNYERANEPLSRRNWPDRARDTLARDPVLLAQHPSQFGSFDVIYAPLAATHQGRGFPLSLIAERLAVNQLLKDHPYALFVFSDTQEQHWHLVNVRYDPKIASRRVFRRIAIGPHERLRTAAERVAMLDLASLSPDLSGLSPLAIQQRHDEAFDVEAVTRKFFTDYGRIFEDTEKQIQGLENEELRLFTLRLFNRLLFITFLERKGWLAFGGRSDYLRALWEAHQAEVAGGGTDANFYRDRLKLLFFSGLNNASHANFYRDRLKLLFFSGLNNASHLDLMRINQGGFLGERIGQVPYLNGGLFEETALDQPLPPFSTISSTATALPSPRARPWTSRSPWIPRCWAASLRSWSQAATRRAATTRPNPSSLSCAARHSKAIWAIDAGARNLPPSPVLWTSTTPRPSATRKLSSKPSRKSGVAIRPAAAAPTWWACSTNWLTCARPSL